MCDCEVPEEFTEDEAKLIAAVKDAICDEGLSTPSDEASITSDPPQTSLTETLLPIVECTSTSFASITDIAKGMRLNFDENRTKKFILIR